MEANGELENTLIFFLSDNGANYEGGPFGADGPFSGADLQTMGSKDTNFHKNLFIRMGYEEEAEKIQDLFMQDKRDEAARVIPDELADQMSLVGPKDRIRDRLQAWRDSKVTTLLVAASDTSELQTVADIF